jgi:hypothetical protein
MWNGNIAGVFDRAFAVDHPPSPAAKHTPSAKFEFGVGKQGRGHFVN